MNVNKQKNTNWGSNVITYPKIYLPKNYKEIEKIINEKTNFVVQGNQRSFGDVALNKNKVVSMKNFTKIISFDKKKGIIEAESGLLLKDLLSIIVPKGWFIPVTPGTKYVSLGGMVANNVIGKNTLNNQIKYHIKKIKIISPNQKNIICSNKINKKIFDLTVGGFGLSGIIITVTLKLKKIYSENIDQKIVEFKNFKEFYRLSANNKNYEYSVCWIDNFNNNKILGLYYLGNSSKNKKRISPENFIINKIGLITLILLRIINSNYYFPKIMNFIFRNYKKYFFNKVCHYNEFFYPQDNVPYWNKIYGNKGFIQVQFLIPENKFENILNEISEFFTENKIFSSFIIVKKFREKAKYLNFSGSGYSISFDFVINNKYKILKTFLNKLFKKYKLKVNFTKDLITEKNNAYNYKEFKNFKKDLLKINKYRKINSLFSKRLQI